MKGRSHSHEGEESESQREGKPDQSGKEKDGVKKITKE